MTKLISKYSVEIIEILSISLIVGPLAVSFLPKATESIWGYLALCSLLAWLPVAVTATIAAIHRLITAKRSTQKMSYASALFLPLTTILLNAIGVYVIFVANMF